MVVVLNQTIIDKKCLNCSPTNSSSVFVIIFLENLAVYINSYLLEKSIMLLQFETDRNDGHCSNLTCHVTVTRRQLPWLRSGILCSMTVNCVWNRSLAESWSRLFFFPLWPNFDFTNTLLMSRILWIWPTISPMWIYCLHLLSHCRW